MLFYLICVPNRQIQLNFINLSNAKPSNYLLIFMGRSPYVPKCSASIDWIYINLDNNKKYRKIMKKNYESFHQQIQLASYEALVLSNPNQIQFPTPTEIRQTIFSTLASFVTFSKINNNLKLNRLFLPIPNEFFLMANGNAIRVFKHFQTNQQQLQCQIIAEIELSFYIKSVKVSPFSKCKKDKAIFLIVEDSSSSYLQTLYLEVGDKSIKKVSVTRIPAVINCWSYIQNRQILIWAQNMKIYHYELQNTGLKLIQSLDTGINIKSQVIHEREDSKSVSRSKSKNKVVGASFPKAQQQKKSPFVLNYCAILGQRGKQQDSVIVLFYVLYNEEFNSMKIKCREILYPFEVHEVVKGYQFFMNNQSEFPKLKMYPKTHQIVSQNTASPEILQAINIVKIEDSYLIRFEFEIIVVQKKFNQEYMVINNIYKKTKECKVSMAYNSNIVACITNNILELNSIDITQDRIQTNMVDFIDLENQYQNFIAAFQSQNVVYKNIKWFKEKCKLFMLWITTDLVHEQHRNHVNFVFETYFEENGEEKIAYFMFNTKHIPRVKKLTALAHKAQKPEDIASIEKLGKSLGISEAQFYYSMWKTSSHSYDDVLMYLLKCKDYLRIISELKGFLRKKSYAATKLQKVLSKLEEIILQLLQQKLTEQHLVDYFHVIFVNRKFQIYESNYEIDERQFTETVEISIYDLFKKIIDQVLFPVVRVDSVWAAEPKKPPKLNLIQVLGYFKLPLLEDYDIFLQKILSQYSHSIVELLQNFPELLPNFPFENLVGLADNSKAGPSLQSKFSEKQRQFFSPVRNEHIKAESNFLDNILAKLFPYYSTSVIKKSFDQVSSRNEIKNQKFIFHSIISTGHEEYKNKLKAMSTKNPTYLYNVVLNSLVKVRVDPDSYILEQKYVKIGELCKIFKQIHRVDQNLLMDMEIMACLFELMIHYEILEADSYTLNDIITEPIQKWITLFFLGNKQQKDLIFSQLMKIYTERKQEAKFIGDLKKFIESEHCSKIQLCILIDLINHMDKEFQKKHQKIIDLIVNGFCSRVEISDIKDATNFKERLCKIQLGQELLLKADKIEKMRLCRYILSNFYLENTLIKDLLDNTADVLNQMLQNFFSEKVKDPKEIRFGNDKQFSICIETAMDMFNLFHFLRENVFYHISAEELIKIYCKKLIIWQRFDQIHELLYDSELIKTYDIDLPKTIQQIQSDMLEELQRMEDFMYIDENKIFINKILEIDQNRAENATVIKMKARIAISQIFLDWKITVKSIHLEQMCRRWEKVVADLSQQNAGNINQPDIMDQIIQTYAEHLNVKSLQQLYKYFLIAVTNNPEPQTKTEKFYRYCTSLCDALLTHRRYKQASEIICIVNEEFEMNYELMAECMLKSLFAIYIIPKEHAESRLDIIDNSVVSEIEEKTDEIKKNEEISAMETPARRIIPHIFNQDIFNSSVNSEQVEQEIQPIELIRLYIHYFVINWIEQDEQGMDRMFSSYFNLKVQQIPILTEVQVHSQLCFNQASGKILTSLLWEYVRKAYENSCLPQPVQTEPLIYCYFFMLMGLFEPSKGFSEICYINYDHKVLVNFLPELMKLWEKNQKGFVFLDYSIIFKKYLDTLTKLLILKYQQNHQQEQEEENKKPEQKSSNNLMDLSIHHLKSDNLSTIREQFMKKGQFKDDPLTGYINKMRVLCLQAEKNCKKRAILQNSQKSVKSFSLATQNKFKMTRKRNLEREVEKIEKLPKKNEEEHMMSFQQFKTIKRTIKDRSHMDIGELDVSQRVIVEKLFDQVEPSKNKLKSKKEIPELEQIIATSLKELEEREARQKELQEQKIEEMEMQEQQQQQQQREEEEEAIRKAAEEKRKEQAKAESINRLSSLFFSFQAGPKH